MKKSCFGLNMRIYLSFLLFFLIATDQIVSQSDLLPLASYHFNDATLNDGTGEVDGTQVGNVLRTNDRFGNARHALSFTDRSAVSLSDHFDIFSTPDARFSFSLWIKNGELDATNVIFLSKYGNSFCGEQQREFYIRINEFRQLEFLYYINLGAANDYRGIETQESVIDTCWHHIVVNYDGSKDSNDGIDRVQIFIDGVQVATQASPNQSGNSGDIQNATAHLSLGTPLNSNGEICNFNYFQGKMDDLYLFDRMLNAAEVNQLYMAPSPTGQQNIFNAQFLLSDLQICQQECVFITDQSFAEGCTKISDWSFPEGILTVGNPDAPQSICYPTAGTFTLTHILGNDYIRDTFVQTINVIDNSADLLGQDTFICAGQTLTLNTQVQANSYLWSDGSRAASVAVEKPGLFWLEAIIDNCLLRDSINVEQFELPVADLGPDQEICQGESILLDASSEMAQTYLWSDGSTSSVLEVNTPGTYSLEVFNQCGSQTDEIMISESGEPLNIQLGNDRLLCDQDTIILDATDPNAKRYRWSTGDSIAVIEVTSPGIYQVTVNNDCFEVSDEVVVSSGDCCKLFVPNVFSPDNDGVNDVFQAQSNCSFLSFRLKIFNRWGGLVFESNDPTLGWDGKIKNQLLSRGTYIWLIEYDNGAGEIIDTGTITLIR